MFILTHPVNFPVGGNRSARRKPTTFGRVLTDSFHMSGALASSSIENVFIGNRTPQVKGEPSDHCPTEAPHYNTTQYNRPYNITDHTMDSYSIIYSYRKILKYIAHVTRHNMFVKKLRIIDNYYISCVTLIR